VSRTVPRASAAKTTGVSRWLTLCLAVALAALVLAIADVTRRRAEQRSAAEAAAATPPTLSMLEGEGREAEDEADAVVDRQLARAELADAPVAALDAAAHALLVRERFEEAEPLVLRALSLAPADAEASIHRAVLAGVLGDTAGARVALDQLARGPAGWEASLFAAGFALREGDEADAFRALRQFHAQAPPGEVTPELAAEIRRLEARVGPAAVENQHQK
jgi:hypothetical protein